MSLQKSKTVSDVGDNIPQRIDNGGSPPPKRDLNRRHTIYYNASNYDSPQKALARLLNYQVVLLGTAYVDSKKIGAKPYTVCVLKHLLYNPTHLF